MLPVAHFLSWATLFPPECGSKEAPVQLQLSNPQRILSDWLHVSFQPQCSFIDRFTSTFTNITGNFSLSPSMGTYYSFHVFLNWELMWKLDGSCTFHTGIWLLTCEMFCNRRLFLGSLPTGNVLFKKGFNLGFEKPKISNLMKYSRQPEQISSSSKMLRDQKWLESWEWTTLVSKNKRYRGTVKQKIRIICHHL